MDDEFEEVPPAKSTGLGFSSWMGAIFVGATFALIANLFFINIYNIPSESMDPTLRVKDYIISVPLLDNREDPERGDVVLFYPPESWDKPEGEVFIKRAIAIGGDTVECCSPEGEVLVNGEPIEEEYRQGGNGDLTYSFTVPEDSIFVLGDNREHSADSRYHPYEPFIPLDRVIGQPISIIYPFNHIKLLNN